MRPIEQACYWLARLPAREPAPLAAPAEHDIVVVGAGLTGLWTALFLKELDPGRDVAVVEQGIAAYGASGRNAGMLSETVDHSHGLALQHFGPVEATRLATLGEQNAAELVAFIRDRGIACDWEPSGRLMVALTEAHLEEAGRSVELAERLGIRTFRLLSREAVQGEVHSPLYLGGVAVAGGGILDPARFTDGLRREAERAGVRVYERTTVESLAEAGAGVALRANGTVLRARRAVLATSAYSHHLLPGLTHRFIPLYDYILVSEPLSPAQWETLGWRHRQGVTDGRTFFNYYRPTADGRVLWGTSEATYYSGNRVDPSCDHSPAHYESLRHSWRRHFPALADLRWEYAWGGAICSTTRLTPFFGRALGGRACYGLGFTGHGLGSTRLAGRILAHLALDRASDLLGLSLVTKPPFPYPPEPLRGLAVRAVTGALRRVDAGEPPNLMLRLLERMGLGFSS
ncbi:MAG: FAD-dependent oxidoreductase [Gemmatimonadetes bacterium]|nr:FAD-dependent oxidoreductase [Gemmatimonadota bacterium]MBK6780017.1 FAD-dependent oxidoreductase [Gemmatimonadota bacterium]MBK7716860.1 FAD-dependent oxidoreductase [Gemmatimonadota bacterium]MBK9067017.1 FAD-dependent oxidoreductase [Gemmatimonadota bacterium]MBK9690183.1 FAD-dependent oxidoreductase [Gemmatimonadota bacterium]